MVTNSFSSSDSAQRGRTLIELVIAMTIGLVIVIGVSSLYLSSTGVSRTAKQVATVEQAGQFAMLMIGESLKLAGYGQIIGSDYSGQNQTLFDGAPVRGCTNSRFATPLAATPDLCTAAGTHDALYVRFQAGPSETVTPMDANQLLQHTLTDCTASAVPSEAVTAVVARAGAGVVRPIAVSVFSFNPIGRQLECTGNGGAAANFPLLNNVDQFKVYFRFDDAAFGVGASGVTNAAPLGGSVRDAAFLNDRSPGGALAGPINAWDHVVAVIVCIRIVTSEIGTSTATTGPAPSCPLNAGEAQTGIGLVTTETDGAIRRTFSQVFTIRSRATASPSLTVL